MGFLQTLSWWQWTVLGLVPPAIVALYFLKLKRYPLEVPSTYLWKKSIEDLHVNSLWQRIRTSLLLFLQLLFVAALMIALLRPHWLTEQAIDSRAIYLLDVSASMRSTDVGPNRLRAAKDRIIKQIEQMNSSDKVMLISFSDVARVEQSYTSTRQLLIDAVERVQPTDRSTSIDGALPLAAGLANAGRPMSDDEGAAAESLPATMYIFSDGRFRDVTNFSLGNLTPKYVPIGDPNCRNAGIVAFEVRRNEDRPGKLQAFARIENSASEDLDLGLDLFLDGRRVDASSVKVSKQNSAGAVFDLGDLDSGILEIRITNTDALAADNRAWAVLSNPRPAKVLLVTSGNEPLERALSTEKAALLADVSVVQPAELLTDVHKRLAASGAFDLIIYDNCKPADMPQADTFFLGQLPPDGRWKIDREVVSPQIIDSDRNHPIMQWTDASEIIIGDAITLVPPVGATRLLDSTKGALLAIAPRDGFEDVVLGFSILAPSKDGNQTLNTTWHIKPSFPTFILDLLQYLGGHRQLATGVNLQPGSAIDLRADAGTKELTVKSPSGKTTTVVRGPRNQFPFSATGELGPYEVRHQDQIVQRFTVNLFDAMESDIRPREENAIQIANTKVEGDRAWETTRFDAWKYLLVLALGLLLFEWYIYNRRVYL
ncbi:MAG: BatA and WFA domain-containing protein [Planctomycetota bacterium]|nr:BatA and WFA domain-containing protein [Planctomycetota bacterium]